MARAATTADVFNAIAEPRRRQIIDLLGDTRARPVGDVVQFLGLAQPAASKHLSVLLKVGIVVETSREEIGPNNTGGQNSPMPMKLEAWPGGRWYRDLGNHAGHFWGNVQVIKPPTLLEICGPMFMSYPGVNHIAYRLKAE